MKNRALELDLTKIDKDQPLRLSTAAALAYPDGSMTASGLRRERDKGRLVIERTAGKEYTTLANIERMRELCRQNVKGPASGCDLPDATSEATARSGQPPGSSSTEAVKKAQAALKTTLQEQKKRSSDTSPRSTSRRSRRARVIPLRSRLPTS